MAYDPKLNSVPIITPELIDYLDYQFKDKAPEITWDDRKVWYMRGSVEVVRHLRRIQQEQVDNFLRS